MKSVIVETPARSPDARGNTGDTWWAARIAACKRVITDLQIWNSMIILALSPVAKYRA